MTENEKLDLLSSKFDGVEVRLDKIDNRLDKVDERLDRIDERLDKVDERLDVLDDEVKGIKLTIENDIWPGIKRISDGHIDLNRQLKEEIESQKSYDMLAVRVGVLESDVAEIKKKIS